MLHASVPPTPLAVHERLQEIALLRCARCKMHAVYEAKDIHAACLNAWNCFPHPQASPGSQAFPSEQLLQHHLVDGLGLPPLSAAPPAQNGHSTQGMPPGYFSVTASQPQEPPALQQISTGAASASSNDRWAGYDAYDASGSSGTRRSASGSGQAAVSSAAI